MSTDETLHNLGALIRLARLDRGFAGAFAPDLAACAHSFRVWLYVSPALAIYMWIGWLSELQAPDADPGAILAVGVIGQVMQILGFPVILRGLCAAFGRIERWPWFVTAYNWFGAAQLMVALGLIGLSGDFAGFGRLLLLAGWLYFQVLEAFMAHTMLGIGAARAMLIVLVDLAFSFGIDAISRAIISGVGIG